MDKTETERKAPPKVTKRKKTEENTDKEKEKKVKTETKTPDQINQNVPIIQEWKGDPSKGVPIFTELFDYERYESRQHWGHSGPGIFAFFNCTLKIDREPYKAGHKFQNIVVNLVKEEIEFVEDEDSFETFIANFSIVMTPLRKKTIVID